MYDHIVGEVIEKSAARAVLRAAGVGYDLRVSLTTAAALRPGESRQLFTILHVVDGTPTLLGFATRAERELARRILGVSGVGPTTALSILSVYSPAEVVAAITRSDHAAMKRVKGVGQKTAERLCLELRDVLPKLDLGEAAGKTVVLPTQSADDAVAALLTLGYSEKEARDKVLKVRERLAEASTEELVKAVLQL
ncbi:MAG: Holliday junction branch migration protein RuvA [Planctomycetes bacterium]|nr:Holliday junction branch migration protein RuvA [Planctomycetota bacterium]